MSAGTIERERGDDRNPEVSVERLNEMYNQPEAAEPIYVSDTPGAAMGEFAVIPLGKERFNRYPANLGYVAIRRIHIRPSILPPDSYLE